MMRMESRARPPEGQRPSDDEGYSVGLLDGKQTKRWWEEMQPGHATVCANDLVGQKQEKKKSSYPFVLSMVQIHTLPLFPKTYVPMLVHKHTAASGIKEIIHIMQHSET